MRAAALPRGLLLGLVAVSGAACGFDPHPKSGAMTCATVGQQCPDGFVCRAGRCFGPEDVVVDAAGTGGTSDAGHGGAGGVAIDAGAGGVGGAGREAGAGGIGGAGFEAGVDAPQAEVATGGSGGQTGTGGATGTGGRSVIPAGTPGPSCAGFLPTCGPSGNESCCTSLLVPGGSFYRSYDGVTYTDKSFPATVSDFALDKYEITVGRFRAFVNAGMGTRSSAPAAGAGAHPLIPGSGWDSSWKGNLPPDTSSLIAGMKCGVTPQTWTDLPGPNENQPQNCLDWYSAFAFCIWDGGRLATETEWNYAASGGNEQRVYPWSSPPTSATIDDTYSVYCGGDCTLRNVGSRSPKGDGRWGHADLEGNAWEWTLDRYVSPYASATCIDCAYLTTGSSRTVRGYGFSDSEFYLRSAIRNSGDPVGRGIGSRCARSSTVVAIDAGVADTAVDVLSPDVPVAVADAGVDAGVPSGTVTTLAGKAGESGSADGTGAAARFNLPEGIAVDGAGNLYVGDTNNQTIRKITPSGTVSTLAGSAEQVGNADGTGAAARFTYPEGIAVDGAGNVYVADFNNQTIRKITPAGAVSTLAGSAGHYGAVDGAGADARFNYPTDVAVDGSGNLYVADFGNNAIRKITPSGMVSTLAGKAGMGHADGLGSDARFDSPHGVAVDAAGNVYVAELAGNVIRKITPAGMVSTLAGSYGRSGSADGIGADARFNEPHDVAVDGAGNLYVMDTFNHTIRKITPSAAVSTLAGSIGQGGTADGIGTEARFDFPLAVAVDAAGNLYVTDNGNNTIRKITP
jgi:formylglycine-generating enzyme required for sulfatase activity